MTFEVYFEAWRQGSAGITQDFQQLVITAISYETINPFIAEHVIIDQQNYTSLTDQLNTIINETITTVYDGLEAQKQSFNDTISQVHTASADAHDILAEKNCTEIAMMQFFNDLIYTTSSRVIQKIGALSEHTWPGFPTLTRFSTHRVALSTCIQQNINLGEAVKVCMAQVSKLIFKIKLIKNLHTCFETGGCLVHG